MRRLMRSLTVWSMAAGWVIGPAGAVPGQEGGGEDPPLPEPVQVAQLAPEKLPGQEGLISLDFRQADLLVVLQALARKARVNIVTSADVSGDVTLHLEEVTWEQALDTLVKTTGLAYEKEDNVILVTTLESMKTRREALKELIDIEPVGTKVVQLKYLDAWDVKTFLEPQLTSQGKISVLEMTGQKGWTFGGAEGGGSEQEERERKVREKSRSKAIVITDTPTTIDRLEKILMKVDTLPKQVLIEARVMEVSRDLLRDLGLDIGTGTAGVETASALPTALPLGKAGGTAVSSFGTQIISTAVAPSIFGAKSSLGGAGTAYSMGLEFLFRKLTGTQFEIVVRALEEDIRTNTLSAPHILTLSGQEASIMVGTKYPILETQVSGTDSTTTTSSLSYYQSIGIELFVVPQVSGDRHVDMIIHPVVSSQNGSVTGSGSTTYPILEVREAETQVVLENGETVVIGGLLKDIKSKSRIGLPFLGKLPLIGPLFSRATTDVGQIDLLIFITAKIIEPGALAPEDLERLRQKYEEFFRNKVARPARPARSRGRREAPAEPAAPEENNRGVLYRKR